MSAKETIERYFNAIRDKNGWESFLQDDIVFTSFVSPVKKVSGKWAYLDSTKRFFSMITSMEVREIIADGNKACALTSYTLKAPDGNSFTSDVAEIFTVKNNKIASLDIYFDTSPFPK